MIRWNREINLFVSGLQTTAELSTLVRDLDNCSSVSKSWRDHHHVAIARGHVIVLNIRVLLLLARSRIGD